MGLRLQGVQCPHGAAKTNNENLVFIILRQCTPVMRVKLESRNDWKTIKKDYNTIDLLKALCDITYKFEGHNNAYLLLQMAQLDVFLMKQGKNESVKGYYERHDTITGLLEGVGGSSLWGCTSMIEIKLKKINIPLSLNTVNHENAG